MTPIPNSAQALLQRPGASIINGPWPTYSQFKEFPERERWATYEVAKAGRRDLEARGFQIAEAYDAFVRRVTQELDL